MEKFDFEQRKKTKRIITSPFTIITLLIVSLFLGNASWNAYKEYRDAGEREARASKDLNDLLSRKSELSAELETLSTERGLEEEIRKRFTVGKAGEGVVIVVDPATDTEKNIRTRSWWERFLEFFR